MWVNVQKNINFLYLPVDPAEDIEIQMKIVMGIFMFTTFKKYIFVVVSQI